MTATGWCEDCGDVEVQVRDLHDIGAGVFLHLWPPRTPEEDCHFYADCPHCGADVDQWAW